jgi:hypothetical protein
MILNRNFLRSVVLVSVFCSAMAEATSKQAALTADRTRARFGSSAIYRGN